MNLIEFSRRKGAKDKKRRAVRNALIAGGVVGAAGLTALALNHQNKMRAGAYQYFARPSNRMSATMHIEEMPISAPKQERTIKEGAMIYVGGQGKTSPELGKRSGRKTKEWQKYAGQHKGAYALRGRRRFDPGLFTLKRKLYNF